MSKTRSIDTMLAEWEKYERPKDGDMYEHYKGGKYEIIATGFLEDTEAPCVMYRSLEKDIVWVRTAKNFLESLEHDGSSVQRFTKVI